MPQPPAMDAAAHTAWSAYLDALTQGDPAPRPEAPALLSKPLGDLELAALAGLWPADSARPLALLRLVKVKGAMSGSATQASPLGVSWRRLRPGRPTTRKPDSLGGVRVLLITDRVDLHPEMLPPDLDELAGLVVIGGPLYPAAIQRLTRLYRCPIHQGIPHPDGGWWAFGSHTPDGPPLTDDGLRLRLLPGRPARLLDGFGQAVRAGQAGYLSLPQARFPERDAIAAVGLADDPRQVGGESSVVTHAFVPVEARQFGDGNRLDCLEFSRIMARVGLIEAHGRISAQRLSLRIVRDADTVANFDDALLSEVLSQRFSRVKLQCIPTADSVAPFSLHHPAPGPRAFLWRGDAPGGTQTAMALDETLCYLLRRDDALILMPLDEGPESESPATALLATHLEGLAATRGLHHRRADSAHLIARSAACSPQTARRLWVDWVDSQTGGLLLVGDNDAALKVLRRALDGEDSPPPRRLRLFGVAPQSQGALAVAHPAACAHPAPVTLTPDGCPDPSTCDACVAICPVDCIHKTDSGVRLDAAACLGCMLCVEHCRASAIHPHMSEQTVLQGDALTRLWGHLRECVDRQARPRHLQDEDEPHRLLRFRLSEHVARPHRRHDRPPVVLGLAMVTMMEHAAALLVDGKLVAAVEEERLQRVKHYRFRDTVFPLASPASDPSLPLFAALPARAAAWVLQQAGLEPEDVDIVAINGLPYRLRTALSPRADHCPTQLEPLFSGRLLAVPHHLAHAASCAALAGWQDEAHILTVDGRGDQETAALFSLDKGKFTRLKDWSFAPDRSIGGVYETATQALGFGSHGQGQLMALAAFGEPQAGIEPWFSNDSNDLNVSEWLALAACRRLADPNQAPLSPSNRNLAATVQQGLERLVVSLFEQGGLPPNPRRVGLAGGVALNCRMNGELRRRLGAQDFFIPAAAHDAGTAIGAAALGHAQLSGQLPDLALGHSYLGPCAEDNAIAAWLKAAAVPHQRPADLAGEVAALIADGALVGWVQDRLEFGPRALGARSILADPRRMELKDRLNRTKGRQLWRPFGVSILAGRQAEWFEEDWDSRYMLFAVQVRPDRARKIPLGVHEDGSTRPQVVHPDVNPRYHALIAAFAGLTGVPMLVNTSFNRGGEPIVNTPDEALQSFLAMDLDALVLGDCLIHRERKHAGS